MKIASFLLALFLLSITTKASDIPEEIVNAIKSGNAGEISKYFSDNVDLKILDKEDVYSKSQAELIIKDFFAKHPVKNFNVIHKSASKNDSQYTIGSLETGNGKFRIYFLLKKVMDKTQVAQFRIEPDTE
jgi:hypothetical protein